MPPVVAVAARRSRLDLTLRLDTSRSGQVFLLDNFDSFTYNVAQAFQKLDQKVCVRRAHETSVEHIQQMSPSHIVISPGPGRPEDHPFTFQLLEKFVGSVPVLGVCLGMQAMNVWRGGTITRDQHPLHGKTSSVFHDGVSLFEGMASPFTAARYHSLRVDKLGSELEITAWTDDDIPMALECRAHNMFGVQFHPESYLTPDGEKILRNFLNV